jgi:ectoine hydroxylase-related dioxygenase (phytanoyl-CoA dioxygenase family)
VERLVRRGSFSKYAQSALGRECFAVRAIFFNKIPKANWHVPWHQDIGIPVKEQRDAPGFHAYTRKEGILHVNAPADVLEGLLVLRLHLDDCTPTNGAMRLLRGSHIPPGTGTPVQPSMQAGDILRMRPLLFHASAHSSTDAPRRVVHIEYAAADLPHGLEWATRVHPE